MVQYRAVVLSTAGAVGAIVLGVILKSLVGRKKRIKPRHTPKCTGAALRQGARSPTPVAHAASSSTDAAKPLSSKPPESSSRAAAVPAGSQSGTVAKKAVTGPSRRRVVKRKSSKPQPVVSDRTAICSSSQSAEVPEQDLAADGNGAASTKPSRRVTPRTQRVTASPTTPASSAQSSDTASPAKTAAATVRATPSAAGDSRCCSPGKQAIATTKQHEDDLASDATPKAKAGVIAAIAAEVASVSAQEPVGERAAAAGTSNSQPTAPQAAETSKAQDDDHEQGASLDLVDAPTNQEGSVTADEVSPHQAPLVDIDAGDAAQPAAKKQATHAPTKSEPAELLMQQLPAPTAPAQPFADEGRQADTATLVGGDTSQAAQGTPSEPLPSIQDVAAAAQDQAHPATVKHGPVDTYDIVPATAIRTTASEAAAEMASDAATAPSTTPSSTSAAAPSQTSLTPPDAAATSPAVPSAVAQVASRLSTAKTEAPAAAESTPDSKSISAPSVPAVDAVAPAQPTAERPVEDLPTRRVSIAPAVDTAEAAHQSSRRSRDSSSSRKMTVADIIRESIKLKKSNERLKQQLNVQAQRKSGSGSGSGSSRSSRHGAARSAGESEKSKEPQEMDAQNTAAPGRAASLDVPLQSELDQAAAVGINPTEQQQPAAEADMGTTSNRTGVVEAPQATAAQAGTAADPEDRADEVSAPEASVVDGSSSGRDRKSTGSGSSSSQQPSLSGADLLRELRSMKSENLELVKMLTAQLQEVRAQNAELMAAFHRGGSSSLEAVKEENDGSGTKNNDGTSTPNTGSELGTFKDRLCASGLGPSGSVTGGSDAGSSMRSAPAGVSQTPSRKNSSLWRWASGGRRIGGAMTADNVSVGDNASIPDTLGSPRSNVSIPVETLVDLLDGWGAR